MSWVLIFLGGGLGSLVRYGFSVAALRLYSGNFPLGTFISNTLSCLILVIIAHFIQDKANTEEWIRPLILIGFCGGFSTFSTFSNETVHLISSGNIALAVFNILVSLVTGIGIIYYFRP
jgi:CrcB protein